MSSDPRSDFDTVVKSVVEASGGRFDNTGRPERGSYSHGGVTVTSSVTCENCQSAVRVAIDNLQVASLVIQGYTGKQELTVSDPGLLKRAASQMALKAA